MPSLSTNQRSVILPFIDKLIKPIPFCRSRCRRRRRCVNSLIRPPWRHVKTLYSKAGYKDLTEPKVHAASRQLKSHTNSSVVGLSFLVFNGHSWMRYGFQRTQFLNMICFLIVCYCMILHQGFPLCARRISHWRRSSRQSPGSTEKAQGLGCQEEKLIFFSQLSAFHFFPYRFPLVGTRSQLWLRADGP